MRRGFPGLALLVQETLKADPHAGHLFVFRGKRGDLVKIIWHDGQGACLFSKRLERGRFIWPTPTEGAVSISPAQLGYMLEGIDWRAPQKPTGPRLPGEVWLPRLCPWILAQSSYRHAANQLILCHGARTFTAP
jgi:transposase